MRITDEGSFGAIQFQDGIPSTTDYKLYRSGLNLYFGTSNLTGSSRASEIDDLADAKYDGSSLFIGESSGTNDDSTFNKNIAVGRNSLKSSTIGYRNIAIGNSALTSNISGYQNTAVGTDALSSNIDGSYNTAVGDYTIQYNTVGSNNTALGSRALLGNMDGNNNVAIGYSANSTNNGGSNNTIIGYQAGRGITSHSKSGNVYLGFEAGYHETSDNKLYVNNDSSATPLIYGNFTDGSERLVFNGKVAVRKSIPLATLHIDAVGGVLFDGGYKLFTDDNIAFGAELAAGATSWSVLSDSTKKKIFKMLMEK